MRSFSLLLLAAALFAVGCSTSGNSSDNAKQDAAERAQARRARAQAEQAKCQSQIGGLLKSEQDLGSHLDVGLNYEDYTTRVGDVRAAYDEVPTHQLAPSCLIVGVQAENALNDYVKAAQIWSKCIDDFNCSTDSIKPQLQAQWSKATSAVSKAKRSLATAGS